MSIIQCYAPIEGADDEEKDDFYAQLQEVLEAVPKHDVLLVTGDLNAKIESDNTGFEQYIGKMDLVQGTIIRRHSWNFVLKMIWPFGARCSSTMISTKNMELTRKSYFQPD